ncbi:MAG: carboxypeptidase-like regulatory domain-containing protein [Bradymonadales bacterium]|jgi:hypothetical protein
MPLLHVRYFVILLLCMQLCGCSAIFGDDPAQSSDVVQESVAPELSKNSELAAELVERTLLKASELLNAVEHLAGDVINRANALLTNITRVFRGEATHCFVLHEDYAHLMYGQDLTCMLAGAGAFPPQVAALDEEMRCCFSLTPGSYQFWAFGQSVSSGIMDFDIAKKGEKRFSIEQGVAVDFLVLDAKTGEPLANALISLSEDSLHLLSMTRWSDEDGYAVFPVAYGQKYSVSVRASNYLPIHAAMITVPYDDDLLLKPFEFRLDHGVELSGRVLSPRGVAVQGAKIHVLVHTSDGGLWNSDVDLPKPLSYQNLELRKIWFPQRRSLESLSDGSFQASNIAHGKISIFASHTEFAPSAVLNLQAVNDDSYGDLVLELQRAYPLLLRTINEQGGAIQANIRYKAQNTATWSQPVQSNQQGFVQLKNLPKLCDIELFGPNLQTMRFSLDLAQISEYEAVVHSLSTPIKGRVQHLRDAVPKAQISANLAAFPQCRASSANDGSFKLEFCPTPPLWLELRAEGLAPTWVYVHNASELLIIDVPRPASLHFVLPNESSEDSSLEIQCELRTKYDAAANSDKEVVENFSIDKARPWKEALAPQDYTLRCVSADSEDVELSLNLAEGEKKELQLVLSPKKRFTGYVLDDASSPVANARVLCGDTVTLSDERGQYSCPFKAKTALQLRAAHWLYGSGEIRVDAQKLEEQHNIRLKDAVDTDCAKFLQENGIILVKDAYSYLVDDTEKSELALKNTLKRGDYLESCSCEHGGCKNFVFVRNNARFMP